jgi:hypothetical protein
MDIDILIPFYYVDSLFEKYTYKLIISAFCSTKICMYLKQTKNQDFVSNRKKANNLPFDG